MQRPLAAFIESGSVLPLTHDLLSTGRLEGSCEVGLSGSVIYTTSLLRRLLRSLVPGPPDADK
jgi:hypothetical protein